MIIFSYRNNQDVEECTYFREVDPAKNEGLFVWDREPSANYTEYSWILVLWFDQTFKKMSSDRII